MHHGYYGVSLSGKTTLARVMCRALVKQAQLCLVYDPTRSPTKGGDWGVPPENIYTDADQFMARILDPAFKGPAHLFVDEAHELFGHGMDENFWLATKGRHFGFWLHLMTQRPTLLHPTVRGQLHKGFLFRLAVEELREIGMDYGHSGVHRISLDRGDFLVLESGTSSIGRGNVFQLT